MLHHRLGFDIGGTFTDFVLLDTASGAMQLHKRLTTPEDPAVGALSGIAEILRAAGIGAADLADVLHGTTLVTNALIERRGATLGRCWTTCRRCSAPCWEATRTRARRRWAGLPTRRGAALALPTRASER